MEFVWSLLVKVGGLAGLITLSWKLVEEFKTFLIIKVEAKKNRQ